MRRNKIGDKLYPGRMDDRLVVSAIESHNATAECANELKYGPDFVSLSEEIYCDMETRITLPLCGGSLDSGGECFDLESSEGHQPAKRDIHKAPRGQAHSKKPTKVVNFGTRK
jgi:hypothetical protein